MELTRTILKTCIICSCCFFFPLKAFAASEVLLEVITENWRPYNYEENGQVKGCSTEIVKKVLERSGLKYSIRVYPWARGYTIAQEKKNCMIYTILRAPQRESLFKWVRPVGEEITTFLYRLRGSALPFPQSIEEAKNYSISTERNSMAHIWLKSNGFKKIYLTTSAAHTMRLLLSGSRSLTAFDSRTLPAELEKQGGSMDMVTADLLLFTTTPYMALSLSTSDQVLKLLQNAYDELLQEKAFNLQK